MTTSSQRICRSESPVRIQELIDGDHSAIPTPYSANCFSTVGVSHSRVRPQLPHSGGGADKPVSDISRLLVWMKKLDLHQCICDQSIRPLGSLTCFLGAWDFIPVDDSSIERPECPDHRGSGSKPFGVPPPLKLRITVSLVPVARLLGNLGRSGAVFGSHHGDNKRRRERQQCRHDHPDVAFMRPKDNRYRLHSNEHASNYSEATS